MVADPYGSPTRSAHLRRVLVVAKGSARTHIKPPYTKETIDDDSKEDVIEDVYDVATREDTQLQRAPLQRYVVRYLNGTICYLFGIKYVY